MQTFHPAHFAFVMATGFVAIALQLQGARSLALALTAVGAVSDASTYSVHASESALSSDAVNVRRTASSSGAPVAEFIEQDVAQDLLLADEVAQPERREAHALTAMLARDGRALGGEPARVPRRERLDELVQERGQRVDEHRR